MSNPALAGFTGCAQNRYFQSRRIQMKLNSLEQLLLPEDLAKFLKVRRETLLEWRERYGMPYVKVGDSLLIPEPHFLEWIERTRLKTGGESE